MATAHPFGGPSIPSEALPDDLEPLARWWKRLGITKDETWRALLRRHPNEAPVVWRISRTNRRVSRRAMERLLAACREVHGPPPGVVRRERPAQAS